jgi:hypothetical protein
LDNVGMGPGREGDPGSGGICVSLATGSARYACRTYMLGKEGS